MGCLTPGRDQAAADETVAHTSICSVCLVVSAWFHALGARGQTRSLPVDLHSITGAASERHGQYCNQLRSWKTQYKDKQYELAKQTFACQCACHMACMCRHVHSVQRTFDAVCSHQCGRPCMVRVFGITHLDRSLTRFSSPGKVHS